jgi:hypothetical protein
MTVMPENTAGDNFPKVLSVLLSHYSERLQVTQNEIISRRFLVLGTQKSHTGPNHMHLVKVPIMVVISGQKFLYQNMLCRKLHCHDVKFTCPAKDLTL